MKVAKANVLKGDGVRNQIIKSNKFKNLGKGAQT